MSIQLQIDEMLELITYLDSGQSLQLKAAVEELADRLADELERVAPELKRVGPASSEGLPFAGTCVPFQPREKGPVPFYLVSFDIEIQQWIDMCEEGDVFNG